ncbi:MAG: hypothetical protein CMG46_13405 [Candidatus Marinimicrobia bacterium]|nr:hypothetical protein [Candidatus Neomarinimicrobiota bacterium]
MGRQDDQSLPDTILISRSAGETRSALILAGDAIEIFHRRDGDVQPGAVYLGKVGKRVPGVNAIFVDIGEAEPGVLSLKPPFPAEGSSKSVTVIVPPRVDKGCVLRSDSNVVWSQFDKAPKLLQPAIDPVQDWWARYGDSINTILCEPRAEAIRVSKKLSAGAPVDAAPASQDLFSYFGIDEVVELGLNPLVPLPCGGSVIIESTSAVTAIDVNSGSSSPSAANREAVTVISRELRRRNIAGHIVIDMIPGGGHKALPRTLAQAMANDPVPTRIAGLTPMGLIELTRQRTGLSLEEIFLDCNGELTTKSVGLQALRRAVRAAISSQVANVEVTAAPDVVALLHGSLRPALAEAQDCIKGVIKLSIRSDFRRSRIEVHAG